MSNLSPKYIVKYQKGSDTPTFDTIEDYTKEAPWGNTWKIRILGQDKGLEAGEDLLIPTKTTSQIPTNLKEVDKYAIISKITR